MRTSYTNLPRSNTNLPRSITLKTYSLIPTTCSMSVTHHPPTSNIIQRSNPSLEIGNGVAC